MVNVLVVEDDDLFRNAICDILKKKGFNLFQAANGLKAIEIMSSQDLHVVLSDIQMPEMDGIELLKWSLKNKPIPFIIMTGFSAILETQSAYDLGAKEFISKPFKNTELVGLINKVLGISDKNLTVVENFTDYCKLSINEFVSGKQADFDIYVKLSETKFVKIAHKGEELLKERILHYKEKGVKYLYVTKEGFSQLVQFNLEVASKFQDSKAISKEKKVNFLKYTGQIIVTKAFINGVDKEVFAEAQSFLELTIDTLTDSRKCYDLLNLLNSHSDYIYAHSVGVALYSVMIAKKMGFQSNQAYFKLSMAGMFHDIGKKEIDNEVLQKHRSLLSAEEKKLIDSHVLRGQEILYSLKVVPDDVIQLVYEHHEDVAGQGYPIGNDKKNQHPLSTILQLTNLFVGLALPGPDEPGMSGLDAIKQIEARAAGRYDVKVMSALKLLLSVSTS
jgi:putative nucleotidyltransferase with HDIG domain